MVGLRVLIFYLTYVERKASSHVAMLIMYCSYLVFTLKKSFRIGFTS